ncbi:MAG TPA: hypothetical protein VM427_03670 [Patescibacteria group bacterium]|nr:hypothetical protein [Patescibacteria group bacterium]
MSVHLGLADGRWATLSLAEQLGNIGSEIGRAISATKRNDSIRFESALSRGLELFDLTLADPRWRGVRLRELCRAREVACDFLVGPNAFDSTAASLDAYFTQFAFAARRNR